jgi:hypothetical protein
MNSPDVLHVPLQATDTARDFTVTEWLDMNKDGQLESGEESREVDVHVANVNIRMDHNDDGAVNSTDDALSGQEPAPVYDEGDQRVEVDLSGGFDAPASGWRFVLPDVPGLEFWTAPTGGTRLTPDSQGNVVDASLSVSGEYDQTLWCSVDPDQNPATVAIDPSTTILAQVLGPGHAEGQASQEAAVPFMSDKDYNGIINTAQQNNPPTPGNNNVVTIAIIIETEGGIFGIGHTGIAISTPGAGFAPQKMQYYDFGPAPGGKDTINPKSVHGDTWWDHKAREYNLITGEATGARVADADLSDILRDLPRLSRGNDVYMVVTQVTAAQADNIVAFESGQDNR